MKYETKVSIEEHKECSEGRRRITTFVKKLYPCLLLVFYIFFEIQFQVSGATLETCNNSGHSSSSVLSRSQTLRVHLTGWNYLPFVIVFPVDSGKVLQRFCLHLMDSEYVVMCPPKNIHIELR